MRRCFGFTRNFNRCGRTCGERKFFCGEHTRQPLVFIVFFIFTVLGGAASITGWNIINLFNKPTLEQHQLTDGEISQKATLSAFEVELKQEQFKNINNAITYFKSAELDFKEKRYRDAAKNYQKSIDAIKTKAAHLNLGIALLHISGFEKAKEALIAGIQIAREKKDRHFEAAFLDILGHVYRAQGDFPQALTSFQDAFELYKELGDAKNQANVLNDVGLVHLAQHRPTGPGLLPEGP